MHRQSAQQGFNIKEDKSVTVPRARARTHTNTLLSSQYDCGYKRLILTRIPNCMRIENPISWRVISNRNGADCESLRVTPRTTEGSGSRRLTHELTRQNCARIDPFLFNVRNTWIETHTTHQARLKCAKGIATRRSLEIIQWISHKN